MKRERIQWTDSERAQVFRHARTFGPPEFGDSQEIWRKMQEILPTNRRRPFDPMTMALVNAERKKGRLPPEPAQVLRDLATPGPTPLSQVMPSVSAPFQDPEPVKETVTAPPPMPAPPVSEFVLPLVEPAEEVTIASLLVDTVLQALYDPRLRMALRSLVAEVLTPESELEQQQAITWRAAKTPRERLPRVLIAGGGPQLLNLLRDIRTVDLRFWGQNNAEAIPRLQGLLKGADVVFVITNFISHKATQVIEPRAKAGTIKRIYWSKPFADLRKTLETFTMEDVK